MLRYNADPICEKKYDSMLRIKKSAFNANNAWVLRVLASNEAEKHALNYKKTKTITCNLQEAETRRYL